MIYKQAKDKLISGAVINSMPKSDGGRVFTISRNRIAYKTAQKLIEELELTVIRIGSSLVEYRKI